MRGIANGTARRRGSSSRAGRAALLAAAGLGLLAVIGAFWPWGWRWPAPGTLNGITIDGRIAEGEWPAAGRRSLTLRDDAGRRLPATGWLAHDHRLLYLALRAPLRSGWDTYLSADWRGPAALLVSQPAPGAWPGYDNYHRQGRRIAASDGAARAATTGPDGVEFELAIPLIDLTLGPRGCIALQLRCGDDGLAEHQWRSPPGSDSDRPATWWRVRLR